MYVSDQSNNIFLKKIKEAQIESYDLERSELYRENLRVAAQNTSVAYCISREKFRATQGVAIWGTKERDGPEYTPWEGRKRDGGWVGIMDGR